MSKYKQTNTLIHKPRNQDPGLVFPYSHHIVCHQVLLQIECPEYALIYHHRKSVKTNRIQTLPNPSAKPKGGYVWVD